MLINAVKSSKKQQKISEVETFWRHWRPCYTCNSLAFETVGGGIFKKNDALSQRVMIQAVR